MKFHQHIHRTVNKASGIASNLLKSTVNQNSSFMLSLYLTHIRPVIEFFSVVWHTGFEGDLSLLEGVQRHWSKQISGLSNMDYNARLSALGLYSVQGRLLRANLIKVWKIFNELTAITLTDIFTPMADVRTQSHPLKIFHPRIHTDAQKIFLS